MTYLAAAFYVLGMIQMNDMISIVFANPRRRRFSPGVEKTARVLTVVLWPMFPIYCTITKGRSR